jgi:hypothetical protein
MPDPRDDDPLADEPVSDDDDLVDVLDEDDEAGGPLDLEAVTDDEPRPGRVDRGPSAR